MLHPAHKMTCLSLLYDFYQFSLLFVKIDRGKLDKGLRQVVSLPFLIKIPYE